MRNWQFGVRGILAVLIVVAPLTLLSCDDSDPVGPPDVPEPEPGYTVYAYIGAGITNTYFSLNTATLKVDTFDIGQDLWHTGLAVSADGTRLYVVDTLGILVVDTKTHATLTVLSGFGQVSVAPDNRHIAIWGGGSVRILDAVNYSVVFEDTLDAVWATFSQNGERLYAYRGEPDGRYVYRLDLTKGNEVTLIRLPFEGGSVTDLDVSPDESEVYLYRHVGLFQYFFEVYDIAADSITFRQFLSPGAGDLRVTRDGRYVYYTDPGTWLSGPPPKYSLARYDTELKIIDSLSVTTSCPSPGLIPCTKFVLTPDDRLLIGDDGSVLKGLFVYDLETLDTVTIVCLDDNKQFLYLTCQQME